MTVKHTLVSLDIRVFALCSLMELHRSEDEAGPQLFAGGLLLFPIRFPLDGQQTNEILKQ